MLCHFLIVPSISTRTGRTIIHHLGLLSYFVLPCLGCASAQHDTTAAAQVAQGSNGVMRMQKPDKSEKKPAAAGTILDQVKYEVTGPSNSELAARIRATVNGVAILDEEVREAVYPYLLATRNLPEPERSAKRKEAFDRELQSLIDREVVLQDALSRLKDRPQIMDKLKQAADKEFEKRMKDLRKRSNIKSDEEFVAFLKAQGLSLDGVRRQVGRQFMAMEYMKNLIVPKLDKITFEQIEEYYRKHPEQFQVFDNVTWQDIFVDASKFQNREAAKQFADQLAAKAKAGEDFKQLVLKHDNGDSSYRNGEGFGHRKGEIKPPEAESFLFSMRDGEVGPVIALKSGFHVIRLVKREYAGVKSFDDKTQLAIRNKMQNEAWELEYKRVVKDLSSKSAIEISRE